MKIAKNSAGARGDPLEQRGAGGDAIQSRRGGVLLRFGASTHDVWLILADFCLLTELLEGCLHIQKLEDAQAELQFWLRRGKW